MYDFITYIRIVYTWVSTCFVQYKTRDDIFGEVQSRNRSSSKDWSSKHNNTYSDDRDAYSHRVRLHLYDIDSELISPRPITQSNTSESTRRVRTEVNFTPFSRLYKRNLLRTESFPANIISILKTDAYQPAHVRAATRPSQFIPEIT